MVRWAKKPKHQTDMKPSDSESVIFEVIEEEYRERGSRSRWQRDPEVARLTQMLLESRGKKMFKVKADLKILNSLRMHWRNEIQEKNHVELGTEITKDGYLRVWTRPEKKAK